MQFRITAYDYTDKDALARRMSVRPRHLENIQKVMEANKILCAGGITNEAEHGMHAAFGNVNGEILRLEPGDQSFFSFVGGVGFENDDHDK